MDKEEAGQLIVTCSRFVTLAENFVEAEFSESMKVMTTEDLERDKIDPGVFIGSTIFGLIRVCRKYGHSFEDQLEQAREMDKKLDEAMTMFEPKLM